MFGFVKFSAVLKLVANPNFIRTKSMKTTTTTIAALFSALLLAAAPSSVYGWGKKNSGKKKETEVNTSDRITALHLSSITVTVYSTHASKEYRVTPATRVTINGNPGNFSGLSTGMDVTVTPGADPGVAAAIEAKTTTPAKKTLAEAG
jgi:hypothetical protein